ncbi:hypothetical protein F5Y18DRAFT_358955 [Xylariaceae sp. FL1019]|nr:hypothetical protein F5Y18DRAFT_358955 [Xylariaceae sp. FL1019]
MASRVQTCPAPTSCQFVGQVLVSCSSRRSTCGVHTLPTYYLDYQVLQPPLLANCTCPNLGGWWDAAATLSSSGNAVACHFHQSAPSSRPALSFASSVFPHASHCHIQSSRGIVSQEPAIPASRELAGHLAIHSSTSLSTVQGLSARLFRSSTLHTSSTHPSQLSAVGVTTSSQSRRALVSSRFPSPPRFDSSRRCC